MNWIELTSVAQLDDLAQRSKTVSCLIYKHSTRCQISAIAKYRLESDWDFSDKEIVPYFLDLLAHGDVSEAVAEKFSVWHESPQILLVRNGECICEASHLDISVSEIGMVNSDS